MMTSITQSQPFPGPATAARPLLRNTALIIVVNCLVVALPAALFWVGLWSPEWTILALCGVSLIFGFGFIPLLRDPPLALFMLVFWLGNFIFLQLTPLVFVLAELSFLSSKPPTLGFASVAIDAGFTNMALFIVFLLGARPSPGLYRFDATPLRADDRQLFKLRAYALLLMIAGVIGAWLMISMGSQNLGTSSYADVSNSLAGMGVYLRLAEFLAIGGLLLVTISPRQTILRLFGVLAILVFCVWRAGYGNRENTVKYLVILWISIMLMRNSRITRKTVLKVLTYSLIVAVLLPIAGIIRSGLPLNLSNYIFLILRDFGYSEVAATLLQGDVDWRPPGILSGLLDALKGLLPRALFPDKGEASAKEITGLVTPIADYYESGEQFAYAPSYIGQAAYWSPNLHLAVVVILASIASLAVVWVCRKERARSGTAARAGVVFYSVIAYQMYFSSIKLDLFNLVAGSILPVVAAGAGLLLAKTRIAPPRYRRR